MSNYKLINKIIIFFQLLGLALGGGFVAFRAAVYDGEYLATWSPLAKEQIESQKFFII